MPPLKEPLKVLLTPLPFPPPQIPEPEEDQEEDQEGEETRAENGIDWMDVLDALDTEGEEEGGGEASGDPSGDPSVAPSVAPSEEANSEHQETPTGPPTVKRPVGRPPKAHEAPEPKPGSFVCHLCGKSCGNQSSLTQHLKNHDSKSCDICGKEFHTTPGTTAQQKVGKHRKDCEKKQPPKTYKCRGCNEQFTNKQKCERHERKGCVQAQCEICGEKFKNYKSKGHHKCPRFHEKW